MGVLSGLTRRVPPALEDLGGPITVHDAAMMRLLRLRLREIKYPTTQLEHLRTLYAKVKSSLELLSGSSWPGRRATDFTVKCTSAAASCHALRVCAIMAQICGDAWQVWEADAQRSQSQRPLAPNQLQREGCRQPQAESQSPGPGPTPGLLPVVQVGEAMASDLDTRHVLGVGPRVAPTVELESKAPSPDQAAKIRPTQSRSPGLSAIGVTKTLEESQGLAAKSQRPGNLKREVTERGRREREQVSVRWEKGGGG
eukprot:1106279-Rhodomonas_salina.1